MRSHAAYDQDVLRRSMAAVAASRLLLATTKPYPCDPHGPTIRTWATRPPTVIGADDV